MAEGGNTPRRTPSTPTARPGGSRRRRLVIGGLALIAMVAILMLGPRTGAMVARQLASGRISAGQLGAAERWLAWSARLDPGDYNTDLLEAACHRRGKQMSRWSETLKEADRKGAPSERIELEVKLGVIQSGRLPQGAETEMGNLAAAGASPQEIVTAMLLGYLARDNAGMARLLLERLPEFIPDETHGHYLWGIYWRRQGDLAQAETRLAGVLKAQPGHEPARAELAELLEEKGQLDRALAQYVELATRSGGSQPAALGLARVLRKLARLAEARAMLAPLASLPEPSPPVQAEMVQIEWESGNYEEAEGWFRRLRLEQTTDATILSAAAGTLALRGKGGDAERLFAKVAELGNRTGWILDLRVRQANSPGDSAAIEELQRLARPAPPTLPEGAVGTPAGPAAELYAVHCSACHGSNGDGRGRAGRNLFPRPRNLRSGKSQLVSTRNGVPTLDDLELVLARGMPGTSMAAFDKLSAADHKLLAEEVLRLQREGVREQVTRSLAQEGEAADEADVGGAVENCTTPGEPVRVPGRWPAASQAAARGQLASAALGCNKCHGDDGIGAADQSLFDDQGEPNRPRDLVHEPFKGGREPESLYLRIVAGMPGTAHPAAWNLPEQQLIDVVEHVRSLARKPESLLTNHQRRLQAASRAYLAMFGSSR